MEMLKIGVDLGAVFQMNEVCEGTYVKGVLFSFLQQFIPKSANKMSYFSSK